MTDWKALAAARCPDIPPDEAARIAPSLEALENAFRRLSEQLTPDIEPAVTFTAASVGDAQDKGRDGRQGRDRNSVGSSAVSGSHRDGTGDSASLPGSADAASPSPAVDKERL